MGSGSLFVGSMAEVVVWTLILFPVVYIAARNSWKIRISRWRLVGLFSFSLIVSGLINALLQPNLEGTGYEFITPFFLPLFVSLAVVSFFGLLSPTVPRPVDTPPVPRTARLNTPAKRLWFLAMLAGLLVCGVTYGVFTWQHPHRDFSRVFDYPYSYQLYKATFISGIVLATLGLLFSLFYDQLLGRLIRWVQGSRSSR